MSLKDLNFFQAASVNFSISSVKGDREKVDSIIYDNLYNTIYVGNFLEYYKYFYHLSHVTILVPICVSSL